MAIDYKKEWNALKKNLTKGGDPYEVKGCMYMTAKQIENGTATILLVSTMTYEDEIAYFEKTIKKVAAYETWTDEEKARSKADSKARIDYYAKKKAQYETKENEAMKKTEAIMGTEFWKDFAKNTNVSSTEYELKNDAMYLRINF